MDVQLQYKWIFNMTRSLERNWTFIFQIYSRIS